MFALPYERDYTLIGTTDENFRGDPAGVAPSGSEIRYLCDTASRYFRTTVAPHDIVHAFAGVRSLYDDGSKRPEDVTRDYHLTLDERFREAPVLTVYGDKITTYRRLAEAVWKRLRHFYHTRPAWTGRVPLPGGDFAWDALDARVAQAQQTWPFLEADQAQRLVHTYGTRIDQVLGAAGNAGDLGTAFGAGLTEAEVRYLMQHEWAESADDVLWRRTKLGLRVSEEQKDALSRFMAAARAAA